jgi:N-hydroxyarylamine O-acetyltransferase
MDRWMWERRRCGISFSDEAAYTVDFVATNYWCQHASESIFNKGPMAALLTRYGRVTMFGPEVRVFSPSGVEVIPLASEAEIRAAADKWFGVEPWDRPW